MKKNVIDPDDVPHGYELLHRVNEQAGKGASAVIGHDCGPEALMCCDVVLANNAGKQEDVKRGLGAVTMEQEEVHPVAWTMESGDEWVVVLKMASTVCHGEACAMDGMGRASRQSGHPSAQCMYLPSPEVMDGLEATGGFDVMGVQPLETPKAHVCCETKPLNELEAMDGELMELQLLELKPFVLQPLG